MQQNKDGRRTIVMKIDFWSYKTIRIAAGIIFILGFFYSGFVTNNFPDPAKNKHEPVIRSEFTSLAPLPDALLVDSGVSEKWGTSVTMHYKYQSQLTEPEVIAYYSQELKKKRLGL